MADAIIDPLPSAVQADLARLAPRLAQAPGKGANLLIATWNIRAFGGLTKAWASQPGAPEDLKSPYSTPANAFQRQFVRTPYAVSLLAGDKTFVLVTLHVVYGNKGADRVSELAGVARWLRKWAEELDDYGQNHICMGDFNIDRKDAPLWQAFTSTDLNSGAGAGKGAAHPAPPRWSAPISRASSTRSPGSRRCGTSPICPSTSGRLAASTSRAPS